MSQGRSRNGGPPSFGSGPAYSELDRLAQVEANVSGLSERVEGIQHALSRVENAVGAIGARLETSARPNWGWIIGGLGFVLTFLTSVMVLGARGPLESLDRLQNEADRLHVHFAESSYQRGYSDAWRATVEQSLRDLRSGKAADECVLPGNGTSRVPPPPPVPGP